MKIFKLLQCKNLLKRLVLVFSLLILTQINGLSQDIPVEKDTVIIETGDTLAMKSYASRFNPRKALLYAAIIPGLGQSYNKKYWKLPLVYGGFALIGLQINKFNTHYTNFKEQLFYNLQNNLKQNPISTRTTENLRTVVDKTRRERDFWIIMVGAMYVLQIVDAHVDAHLKEFDLNPNLRVSVQPTMKQDDLLGRQTGVTMVIKF